MSLMVQISQAYDTMLTEESQRIFDTTTEATYEEAVIALGHGSRTTETLLDMVGDLYTHGACDAVDEVADHIINVGLSLAGLTDSDLTLWLTEVHKKYNKCEENLRDMLEQAEAEMN